VAGYEVFIKPSALKELESVGSRKLRRSLAEHIEALTDNPRPQGCRKLTGADRYRIRRGAYRVVYSIEDERRIVVVVKIGHRRDVYR
jgi:mRNA interferase RelE/StbE